MVRRTKENIIKLPYVIGLASGVGFLKTSKLGIKMINFKDTEKQVLELFAHTLDNDSKSFNPEYRISSDQVQIESLTGKQFFMKDGKMILLTDHLCFVNDGMNISFFRMFLECFSKCRCGKSGCTNEV